MDVVVLVSNLMHTHDFCHNAEKKSCLHYNLAPECAVINSKNRIIYWLIAFVLLITCLLLLVLMVVKT